MTPLPGKAFMIAGALALAGIVAGAFAGAREPAPTAKPPVVAESGFVDRWEEPPLLKKGDRLKIPDVAPAPVRSEPVAPPATKPAPVVMVQTDDDDDRPVARRHRHRPNVCERHGMRKVSIRGGRSWRCRR
jgi:hypothetical protein